MTHSISPQEDNFRDDVLTGDGKKSRSNCGNVAKTKLLNAGGGYNGNGKGTALSPVLRLMNGWLQATSAVEPFEKRYS